MSDRWGRFAPLTGVLFAALVIGAVFTSGEETPKANASVAKVVAFYTKNRSEVETSGILFALAFLVLVLFAGALRSYLRRTGAADGLGALVLAGYSRSAVALRSLGGAALPQWLGWVAIVLAIVVRIPPASFPALIGFVVWSIIVSILMYQRSGQSAAASTPAAQVAWPDGSRVREWRRSRTTPACATLV